MSFVDPVLRYAVKQRGRLDAGYGGSLKAAHSGL